ncbi:glycosyl hydrolase family 65 protein [Thiorhodovibrio frisius]|uniref:glycosyl hydrolase family 65 protein n=1 Tax=Thiorhodovibrio frisius TaxID=631362 RepID=UPI00022C6792|nr:Cellobiose phosphorylase [Thiorhodovibrio frisius]
MIAADVYGVAPHIGRGGWTWYTGSAGWMYRLILKSLLGLHLEGNTLRITPCLPADWNGFKLSYRYRETLYTIEVNQASEANSAPQVTLDGVPQDGLTIPLSDDRRSHAVEVSLVRTGF